MLFYFGKCHCDKNWYSFSASTCHGIPGRRAPLHNGSFSTLPWWTLGHFHERGWLGAGPRGSLLIRGLYLCSRSDPRQRRAAE